MAALTVAGDEAALAEAAAARIAAMVDDSLAARGAVSLCLTGGRTPERLYRMLADPAQPWRARIDWRRVHLFWGDERHVPPDHLESNYGMAARALVDRVPIPPQQIHRMRGELAEATEAARLYERELPETLDVMLLGLGEDAHIASLFPDSPLLQDLPRGQTPLQNPPRVAAVWAPHLNTWRITLTPPAILGARAILMLVAGEKKADAVRAALEASDDPVRYPAHLLRRAEDRVEWIVDRSAAATLRAT